MRLAFCFAEDVHFTTNAGVEVKLDISRELTKRYPREDLPPLVALTANVLKDKQEYLNAGMDDVLSKPLSVPALTAMIKKFWDTQDDEESTVTTEENSKSEALLDIPMLEQYLELVGPKLITDGLAVFEKMMPGYVSVLESNLTAQDKKGIVEEGHKIKGAAGYAICNSWVSKFSLRTFLPGKITSVNGLKR